MTDIRDLGAYAQQGVKVGQKNRLTALLGKAYNAPQGQRQQFLGQAAEVDPNAAMQAQGAFQQQDDQGLARAAKAAQFLASIPEQARPQVYQQMLPSLRQIPLLAGALPDQYDQSVAEIADHFAQTYGSGASGQSAGQQELAWKLQQAGYKPGTPEYEHAMRVALRTESPAATGGAQIVWKAGADGRPRPHIFDPTTQQLLVQDNSGNWVPSGPQGAQAETPQPAGKVTIDPAMFAGVDPATQQALLQQIMADANGQKLQPQTVTTGGNPALSIGRAPDAQAGLTELAKQRAQISTLADRGAIEAQNEAAKVAAAESARASAEVKKTDAQTTRDAKETLDLLDQVERILPNATSGGLQNMAANSAEFFGKSTDGAKATAQLQIISAKLVGKVPRFQGPQSDKDVQLYKDAAGDLANANLSVGKRLAAASMMRLLQEKYASNGASPSGAGGSGTSIDDLVNKYSGGN